MFNIGIDIAKRKHTMAVIGEGGEIIIKGFTFANTTEGFARLLHALSRKGVTSENSRVCMESTGHYGRALRSHLEDYGFDIREVNPILTANWNKTQSVRKVKNDAIDALSLARWSKSSELPGRCPQSKETEEIKALARSRTFQIQIIGDLKRKAVAILDEVFPEYAHFFSDTFGKSPVAILTKWPTADALAHARIDAITSCLAKASRGKFGREKAHALKELAKNSCAASPKTGAKAFQLRQHLELIAFVEKQIESLDHTLEVLLAEIDSPITTIPGIGPVCAATILGEIGDVTRFARSNQLIAFAGYDPSVFESGNFKGKKNHISKRGSKYLRWALWVAADRARMFDPVFKAFYEKKRLEGKSHKVAVCATARKLCNTVYAVLRDGEPYHVKQA